MNIEKDLIKLKEYLNERKKSLSLDEIYGILNWSPKYKKDNREIIESWVSSGEIVKNNKGKYNTPENVGIVKGVFSVVKNKFAFVDTETEGIFIPRRDFNGALNGDTVLARVTESKSSQGKKEGEVYKILKRERDTVVGILSKKEILVLLCLLTLLDKIYIFQRNF